jgi:HEPN domain-containing protein
MKQHEAWLLKADNDLRSAKKLIKGNNPILDTAVFHAQQCAEKALKAYLAFKKQPLQRTHDLVFLIELCIEFDNGFERFVDEANILSPYSSAFRYPDIILEPDKKDVLEAIEKAERILAFTRQLIKK